MITDEGANGAESPSETQEQEPGRGNAHDDQDGETAGGGKRTTAQEVLLAAVLTKMYLLDPAQTVRVIRVIDYFQNPKVIDSKDTVATKLFGQKASDAIYAVVALYSKHIFGAWILSIICGLSSLFGLLPTVTGWLVFLPGSVLSFFFLMMANPHLLWRLARTFTVWYLIGNAITATLALWDVFKYDGRAAFVALWCLGSVTIILFDAAHPSAQKFGAVGVIAGILSMLIVIPGLYFGVVSNLESHEISLTLSGNNAGVPVTVNILMFALERLGTILLFFCKHLVNIMLHPEFYINIKSRVDVERTTVQKLCESMGQLKTSVRKLSTLASLSRTDQPVSAAAPSPTKANANPNASGGALQRKRPRPLKALGKRLLSDDEKVRVLMVEEKFQCVMIIDSKNTVAAALFGRKIGGLLFGLMKQTGIAVNVLFVTSAVCGTLCLYGIVPIWSGWLASLGGSVVIMEFWLFAHPPLLWKLFFNFDVWYQSGLATTAAAALVHMFNYDGRAAFTLFVWNAWLTIIWFDAAHPSTKRFDVLIMIIGIVNLLLVIFGLHFGVISNVTNHNIDLSFSSNVKVSINLILFVNERLAVILLFFCRNLFNAVAHPNCFINIKSRVMGGKIKVGELRKRLAETASTVMELASTTAPSPLGSPKGQELPSLCAKGKKSGRKIAASPIESSDVIPYK
jgi:hypothetical protein